MGNTGAGRYFHLQFLVRKGGLHHIQSLFLLVSIQDLFLQGGKTLFFHFLYEVAVDMVHKVTKIGNHGFCAVVLAQVLHAHIHTAVEILMEILVIPGRAVHNGGIFVHNDTAIKDLGIIDQDGTSRLVHTGEIIDILQPQLLYRMTVVITVEAVIREGRHPIGFLQLQQPSLGRTAVHIDGEIAPLFIHIHGKVCSFFVQAACPVGKATTDALFFHEVHKRDALAIRLKQVGPKLVHLCPALFLCKEGKQLTICRNKLSTGNHMLSPFYPMWNLSSSFRSRRSMALSKRSLAVFSSLGVWASEPI